MPIAATARGRAERNFLSANRIHHSFVATNEKRILLWLAPKVPARINSDHLTLLGFVSQCFVGVCYALARVNPNMLLVGVACLALNWLGDSLDGTLARVRNRQRPRYGFYVDHIADSIAAFFLMGGMAISGYVHPAIALGMLIAFLMLSIEAYLATYTLGTFRLSYWKFGPTEIRILLACGNIALLTHSTVGIFHQRYLLFDFGGIIAIVGMAGMLIVSTIQHTAQLYKEERIL
jgi:archaetidylinositol phosphate synthase